MSISSKGLSSTYVRRVFRAAGFPLTNGGYGNRYWSYRSSVVNVRYTAPIKEWSGSISELTVWDRYSDTEFTSATRAVAYIQAKLSMRVVAGNDWALNTGPRGQLEAIVGGAA